MLIAAIPCKHVRMEHIRPLHVSMRIRLCFMLTLVSANIMLQTVDSGLCAKTCSQTREIVKNGSQTAKCISQTRHAPKCRFL